MEILTDFPNLLISCLYSPLTALASLPARAHSALITVFCRHLFTYISQDTFQHLATISVLNLIFMLPCIMI